MHKQKQPIVNGQTGAGASWDYSNKLGADNALTVNELSAVRNLRFNNPRNEPFTFTFNVIGNLARGSSSSPSANTSSSSAQPEGSSSTGSATPSAAGTVSSMVFKVLYDPLLNAVTVQLIKP